MRTALLSAALLAASCSNSSTPQSAQAAPGAPVAATASAPSDKKPEERKPPADDKKPSEVLAGTLTMKLASGPYSLLKLKTASGEVWAAVPRTDRKVGEEIKVIDPLPVKRFESKPLKRTFDIVYFGNLG